MADLAVAANWSVPQARAVVEAMERMAERGFSLGKPTGTLGVRYWPVPPLGVFYAVAGDELLVLQIVDALASCLHQAGSDRLEAVPTRAA